MTFTYLQLLEKTMLCSNLGNIWRPRNTPYSHVRVFWQLFHSCTVIYTRRRGPKKAIIKRISVSKITKRVKQVGPSRNTASRRGPIRKTPRDPTHPEDSSSSPPPPFLSTRTTILPRDAPLFPHPPSLLLLPPKSPHHRRELLHRRQRRRG
jgi:hypothetical protein